jgi:hypothetical protein
VDKEWDGRGDKAGVSGRTLPGIKKAGATGWCPACRDCFTVVLLINDLPAIIRFDKRDSSSTFFVIDNSCHIAFIAFIRYFHAVMLFD